MKAICPHCGAMKRLSWRQADSGKPIICDNCGKDMRQYGSQSTQEGVKK